jgi:glycosyltransferase involved in cell wall biosynthesis
MKILVVSHYFSPEPNLSFAIPFAHEMIARGHSVQVLTGFPNYPGGKLYSGYKMSLWAKDLCEGITVYRFPLYPSHDRSSFRRILCYCSLAASIAVLGPWAVEDADVALVVQGPATLGLPALILDLIRDIPFVYNIQDLWPDTLRSTGMFDNALGIRMIESWCGLLYRRAARITVISPGMKDLLIRRGVQETKIETIYNWCDDEAVCSAEADPVIAEQLGFQGRFNVVYAGNMGKAQALEAVIKAAALLQQDYPAIQFVLLGGGVELDALQALTKKLALKNLVFLPRRPVREVSPILRQADALLVHLRKDQLFGVTVPSKTQAYLALGIPILIGVEGDAAKLVADASAGLACEPENPVSIADAVVALYNTPASKRRQMGLSGKAFYRDQLSVICAADKYENIFEQTRRKRRRP